MPRTGCPRYYAEHHKYCELSWNTNVLKSIIKTQGSFSSRKWSYRKHVSVEKATIQPWLVWLSGLTAGLPRQGSLVQPPVRPQAWVPGVGAHERQPHTDVSLPLSLPSPPSKNKLIFKKKKEKKNHHTKAWQSIFMFFQKHAFATYSSILLGKTSNWRLRTTYVKESKVRKRIYKLFFLTQSEHCQSSVSTAAHSSSSCSGPRIHSHSA